MSGSRWIWASVLLGFGCGSEEASDPPPAPTAKPVVEQVILPAVDTFAAHTAQLATATEAACLEGGTIDEARLLWKQSGLVWRQVGLFDFGPLDDDLILPSDLLVESMRQRGIDYTDTVRATIEAALTSSVVLDSAYFDKLRFTEIGLLGLEVALFESTAEGHPTGLAAVRADFEDRPRKCEFAAGLARRLEAAAVRIRSGWRDRFGATGTPFADQMAEDELPEGGKTMARVLLGVGDEFDYLQRRKLDGVLDGQISETFYSGLGAMLEGVEAVLAAGTPSLQAALREASGATADRVADELARARAAIQSEDRGAASAAFEALATRFRTSIPNALNIELSLNFSDGD